MRVAFRPDGKVLASVGGMLGSGNGKRELYLWELDTGRQLPGLITNRDRYGSLTGVAFDPTGRRIALAVWCNGDPRDHDAGFVEVWDVDGKRRVFTLERHKDFIEAVAWSGDGATIASASSDRTVRLWDTATGKERLVLTGHQGVVRCVAFSPDSTLVASGGDAFGKQHGPTLVTMSPCECGNRLVESCAPSFRGTRQVSLRSLSVQAESGLPLVRAIAQSGSGMLRADCHGHFLGAHGRGHQSRLEPRRARARLGEHGPHITPLGPRDRPATGNLSGAHSRRPRRRFPLRRQDHGERRW